MKTAEPDKNNNDGALPGWNLADLFASKDSPALADALLAVERDARVFSGKYEGKLARLSAPLLSEAIEAYEKIMGQLGRISAFVSLTCAAASDEKSWGRKMETRLQALSLQLMSFPLEINHIKETDLLDKITDPALAKYRAWIRQQRSFREHQVSDASEKYIHEKSFVAENAWRELFDMTRAGLRFDVQGNTLTIEEVRALVDSSQDPEQRREIYAEFARGLEQHKNIFSLIANTLIHLKADDDEHRKLPAPEAASRLSAQTSPEAADSMMNAVHESFPQLSHRYYAWKAKKLGGTQLHPADLNASLPGEASSAMPWETAQGIVLDAYGKFSPVLAAEAKNFFDDNHIDAEPRAGKHPGAFIRPVAGAHPYILMNYSGSAGDVQALARMLGAGTHHALAAGQGCLTAAPSKPLEMASGAFGEMLVFHARLAAEGDLVARRNMLARQVEDMLENALRPAALFIFEQRLHQERKSRGELPPERIAHLWVETQKEWLGPAVNLGVAGADAFWMDAPSFIHAPFDSCASALGALGGYMLYDQYAKAADKGAFAQKYTGMLATGGSISFDTALAGFGIDTADAQLWKRALAVIGGQIDVLAELDQRIEAIRKKHTAFKESGKDISAPAPLKPENPDDKNNWQGPAP